MHALQICCIRLQGRYKNAGGEGFVRSTHFTCRLQPREFKCIIEQVQSSAAVLRAYLNQNARLAMWQPVLHVCCGNSCDTPQVTRLYRCAGVVTMLIQNVITKYIPHLNGNLSPVCFI